MKKKSILIGSCLLAAASLGTAATLCFTSPANNLTSETSTTIYAMTVEVSTTVSETAPAVEEPETTVPETTQTTTQTETTETTTVSTETTEGITAESTESGTSETVTTTVEELEAETVPKPKNMDLYWEYTCDNDYLYFPDITVSWKDYYLLCNCTAHEYGAYWVPDYEKALVCEVVMNRVWNNGGLYYDNAIYDVITAPRQFSGSYTYADLDGFSYKVNDSVKSAVNMYLYNYASEEEGVFDEGYTGFYGDGTWNYFH